MSVSLEKGGNVNLSKEVPGLKHVNLGLGWNANTNDGAPFDLDASLFMLTEAGKVADEAGFIFYNNKTSADGSIVHQGDNTTGDGDGDDEVIKVDLSKVPAEIKSLAVVVTIHKADERHQNFGMVNSAYMRVVNDEDQVEIAKFDLTEDASTATAMVFGEIYIKDGAWKFRALGTSKEGGLKALAESYGIAI